jgi:hypothetical protein
VTEPGDLHIGDILLKTKCLWRKAFFVYNRRSVEGTVPICFTLNDAIPATIHNTIHKRETTARVGSAIAFSKGQRSPQVN